MQGIVRFFLTKSRLNYTFFLLLLGLGIYSYIHIPKGVFPNIKLDQVLVSGYYSGASIDNLNKMAVSKLEKDLSSISGVEKIETFIENAEFSLVLSFQKGINKYDILNKIKDVISNNKGDLPQDMDEPRAVLLELDEPLLDITIFSKTKSHDELVNFANKFKTHLSLVEGVSKVELNESTDRVYEIILDKEKIELYSLNKQEIISKIQKISYTFPLGKIEDRSEHLFLSSQNGAKSVKELLNTIIKIDGKEIYIYDIAKVEKKFKKSDVLSFLNGGRNVELTIYKSEKANAISLAKNIHKKVKEENLLYENVSIDIFNDSSLIISKRLNTVISAIMFGLLLVSVALYLLINKRLAFIVVIGIPTAILIGMMVLYFTPYTINNITLIGVLLILGVLVDDAVIIAENIQRHINNGEDKFQSAIDGTKEVLAPILASSLTTIFAFLPMLLLTGEMGEFLRMIPLAVIILIIASIIESFIFLPLHGFHFLNTNDKELDWTKAKNMYKKCLTFILRYKKQFVLSFAIIIPTITVLIMMNMRFQLLSDFDEDKFFIKGKFTSNHSAQEVYIKAKKIEDKLLELKDKLGIKTVAFTVGQRTDNQGNNELKPSVFEFTVGLEDRVPQNFVEEYLTPILSFSSESFGTREKSLNEIVLEVNKIFKSYKLDGLEDFSIKTLGAGITDNDIEIFLASSNQKLLYNAISELKQELKAMDGIIFVDDAVKKGIKEIKIKVNEYGQSLGFSESDIASTLAGSYLKSSQTKGLDSKGIIEFITYDNSKNSLEEFKNYEIKVPNSNAQVILSQIVDFTYIQNFNSLYKINGVSRKAVIANVDNETITASEVLEKLEHKLKDFENKGVQYIFGGEEEQNKKMEKELSFAFVLAIFLIFITLLAMFNSFKYTLLVLGVIPFSILGSILGHLALGLSLTIPSFVGILGLAGVVINNAIVMLDFIKNTTSIEELIQRASLRLRPIIITSITTFVGLSTLIFFATGSSKILQPIAVSLGFGLLWGTVLTLVFLPTLFVMINKNIKG